MMSTFTSAPWAVEQGEWPHAAYTVITARHAGMTPRSPLALIGNIAGVDEALPDARLISAAPDMYEALVAVTKCGNGGAKLSRDASDKARAAIAKAEGQS